MNKKRKKQLNTICKNLLVCSQRTIDEVLRYLEEEEREYVISEMGKIKSQDLRNSLDG